MEKSKEHNDVFFDNFHRNDDMIDLSKTKDDLLREIYERNVYVSDIDIKSEQVDVDKNTVIVREILEEKSDQIARNLLNLWFCRGWIWRRTFDVVKYSTLAILLFGGMFALANYESYWVRIQYAYENFTGKDEVKKLSFMTSIVSEFEKYKNKYATILEDRQAKKEVLQQAQMELANGTKLGVDSIPELGFQDKGPVLLGMNNIGYEPAPTESRLVIPKIKVNVPIAWPKAGDEESILKALEDGVAHFPGTAMPGQYGNVFLTGHSSYYAWSSGKYKSVFALLDKLEIGDEIIAWHGGQEYNYQIFDKFVVTPDNLDVLNQNLGEKILSLMTCTPIGTNKNRLIYRAKLVE